MVNDTKVAVVTGAGRGIGRSIALRLAADGFDVAGTWNRNEAAADTTAQLIEQSGRRCRMYRVDAADQAATASFAESVRADFGRADALIHNAGIASRGKFVADTDPAEVIRVVSVHALGAFYLCAALTPLLRVNERSAVVLMSSVATTNPTAGGAPYMMGKAALEALGRTLELEEQKHGIRVNIVAPGLVATEMGDRLANAVAGTEDAASLDAGMPFGRVTRPDDVANLVSFLVSERAAQISGQRIEIHGGRAQVAP
ncbi:oxidoreductase [Nocardia nova]|uniref:Oxidoreductase n=1 Tax=Nocardia nova TaxID=37330 RepID=A0A2S6AMZ3_9NOCA|nr:SDR family NAD(P)-dependent oxidoreductase [Nocardia nova]PPJ25791.1 oxidoreductase [Nocardia nova]PPJ36579.1 oxidoreductase [Nocardia nova]